MILGLLAVALSQGPASAELQALVKADQAVRQFTTPPSLEVLKKMEAGDHAREARVRQLLFEDKVSTKEDLDAAALIMQHGQDPGDYELARELSILACFNGKLSSLPALAEDRFLTSIKRKQRFGSQFSFGADGKLIMKDLDEEPPYAVTDGMRMDMLIPPLKDQKEKGFEAFTERSEAILKRAMQRRDKKWLAEAAKWPESKKLRELLPWLEGETESKLLDVLRRDRLGTPQNYCFAAQRLMSSKSPRARLLANELAMIAAMRGYEPAKFDFAESWDLFLQSIGRPDRYGTISDKPKVCRFIELEYNLFARHFLY